MSNNYTPTEKDEILLVHAEEEFTISLPIPKVLDILNQSHEKNVLVKNSDGIVVFNLKPNSKLTLKAYWLLEEEPEFNGEHKKVKLL